MIADVLARLGLQTNPEIAQSGVAAGQWARPSGGEIVSINPATGQPLGRVLEASRADYDAVVGQAEAAFARWRMVPPPQRGEAVRQFGQLLREHKADLGLLVTLETGKLRTEGEGEVQEMIDMCDFAVGLSRQLYGLTIASERPRHRMFEQWHPLGPVGVITAFNFPVAVWAWNAAVAAVCGDPVIWKPSSQTPLTAVAVQHLLHRVMRQNDCPAVFSLCVGGGSTVGDWMSRDRRLPLVSATGSCGMGRRLAQNVAARLGRSLLELGGNNAILVTAGADLDLALRAVVFAAVGTTGQRCTTARRLLVERSVADDFVERLVAAYRTIHVGDPWKEGVLMGPLINQRAVDDMLAALDRVREQGGQVISGGGRLERPGFFVEPTLVRAQPGMPMLAEETFAPILYILPYDTLDEAIALHNAVPQGLSSAIFTDSLRQAERFLSAEGSDCGIANVNVGTSGAEIGGAFGGEKETGGGREAGSDSWKAYMRRQTSTINWGGELPLAQGVVFDLRQGMG